MNKQDFKDFLEAQKELNKDENFQLFITEMNFNELIQNYSKEVNSVVKNLKSFTGGLHRISEEEIEGIDRNTIKLTLKKSFKDKLEDTFNIYKPSEVAYERAINRFYDNLMPFKENKAEFKDAISWETIYDYACNYPENKVYFISKNHSDFANQLDDGKYVLHSDFDDLEGQIKYFNLINEFLKEIDYLKVHDFSFQEIEHVMESIMQYIERNAAIDQAIEIELNDFFSNSVFYEDFYEGWGTEYFIERINKINIDDFLEVLEHEEYFYIPIICNVTINYAVEMKNPIYEGEEDEEFLQSDMISDDFTLTGVAYYNINSKKVEKLEEVMIEL